MARRQPSLPRLAEPNDDVKRRIDEGPFLDWALGQMRRRHTACFLDSAGPLGPRSQTSYLSGPLVAVIKEVADGFEVHHNEKRWQIPEPELGSWLDELSARHYSLFPLMGYEGLNPWVSPRFQHPVWQAPHTLILVTAGHWTYDRDSNTLRGPSGEDQSFECPTVDPQVAELGWRDSRTDYLGKIAQIQRDIYEGEYYQANLSQRFVGQFEQTPVDIYRRLRELNPSPYMGLFRYHDHWVLSGSPELLIQRYGDQLSTRPIAGTRPRDPRPKRDAALKKELQDSEKEQAEHLMLVDLARNDIGRVAAAGSVAVEEFGVVESYSHVHHLVSHVVGSRLAGVTNLDIIRSMSPGGTITGAPKIACMQALAELEGEHRGPYTGTLGVIKPNGDMILNILIRTLIQRGRLVSFHGGGGIVADSQPEAEFNETLHKMRALMAALGMTDQQATSPDLLQGF